MNGDLLSDPIGRRYLPHAGAGIVETECPPHKNPVALGKRLDTPEREVATPIVGIGHPNGTSRWTKHPSATFRRTRRQLNHRGRRRRFNWVEGPPVVGGRDAGCRSEVVA